MATLKLLGDFLEENEWTGALTQTYVVGPGTADSFLKAVHMTRTLRAQVHNNFESWRSQVAVEGSFPDDILLTDNPKLHCSCLCKYVSNIAH